MKITIIEYATDTLRLQELAKTERFLVFPLFNENSHPVNSLPIVIFAKPLKLDELFVFSISHSECMSIGGNLPSLMSGLFDKPFVYNKKYFNIEGSVDIESIYYVQNMECEVEIFKRRRDWEITPIYKIIDAITEDLEQFSKDCLAFSGEDDKPCKFINQITLPTLAQIERYGLRVDDNFDKKELIQNGYVYSQYNHLTTTGRPSNRYGNVNYNALNKENGSRTPFISRFENGTLFLLDYDGYHVRLIAKLMGYDLPPESVHAHFAKQYFNVDHVTEEMYDESKKITFRMLYGGLLDEYAHITYFRQIPALIAELWADYRTNGYIPSVISQKPIIADSDTKLFNYIIQNYETEQNLMVMRKILIDTQAFKSVPVLYTYDSILFDVEEGETESYLHTVKKIMEINGQFPVKTKYGKNYNEMTEI